MTGPTLETMAFTSGAVAGIVSFMSWRRYRLPASLTGVLASLAIVTVAAPAVIAPNVSWLRTPASLLSLLLSLATFVVAIRNSRHRVSSR